MYTPFEVYGPCPLPKDECEALCDHNFLVGEEEVTRYLEAALARS
jgi:hypothetical protein